MRHWNLQPKRVLHVGAHAAEELDDYRRKGWGTEATVWVEADPESVSLTRRRTREDPNSIVVAALAWDRTGEELRFSIASNGESSSALAMDEHNHLYPDVEVVREIALKSTALRDSAQIRSLAPFDLVNLDVQGAELRVLIGLGDLLDGVSAVYSEVFVRSLYTGNGMLPEMDSFLKARGFRLVDLQMTNDGWGDALWMRHDIVPAFAVLRRQTRRAEAALRRPLASLARRFRPQRRPQASS